VLQESLLVQLEVNPILMLAIQNIGAAVLLGPVLVAAQGLGYEDVGRAFAIIFGHHEVVYEDAGNAFAMVLGHHEVFLMVLWLCVQTVATSSVTLGLIMITDSFWAVAARSARVVFWWSRQLCLFYLTSNTLLSVVRPHASLWLLVMVCGIVLAFTAAMTDRRQVEEASESKAPLLPSKGLETYQSV